MKEAKSHIPTEVYLDFLGRTIEINWDYHAYLMVGIWFVLVPLSVISIRFFKPKPTFKGITEKISPTNIKWWWFHFHKYGLYFAIGLSLVGLAIALVVSKGFSGSMHSIFGVLAIAFGCLQVVSSWVRGTHGGKYYNVATLDDPSSWHGDHYNMTTRRRLFEAYHKTAGYLAGFFAIGAVASGLMQFHLPILAGFVLAFAAGAFVLWMVFEYQGRRMDSYRAVFGYDPDHPYNVSRKEL